MKGLPTACGAERWVDRIAQKDAEVVARLRTAGAVIMGKTVTTAYACLDPPVTRNPWNLERTPGGSSSGSAAAVACGMCYGALGTQTGGSITRPAAFCGVSGMKPGKMTITHAMQGLLPFAESLDHVGPIGRTVDDLRLLLLAMADEKRLDRQFDFCPPLPVRLGRPRGFFDRLATPALRSVLDEAVQAFVDRGADIVELDDPVDFEAILQDHRTVLTAEAAKVHSDWLDDFPDDYPPRIREIVLEGRTRLALDYIQARDRMTLTMFRMMEHLNSKKAPAWITPAAPSTAPDRATTGDPSFNCAVELHGAAHSLVPNRPRAGRPAGCLAARRLAIPGPETSANSRVVRTSHPNPATIKDPGPWPATRS